MLKLTKFATVSELFTAGRQRVKVQSELRTLSARNLSENPIFSGKLGIYDGVIVHQCNRVINTPTGNGGIPVGHALFLGAQAGVFALGGSPTWEEDTFDYKNKFGVSFGHIFGIEKAQFKYDGINLTDFGVINVLTSTGSSTI